MTDLLLALLLVALGVAIGAPIGWSCRGASDRIDRDIAAARRDGGAR